MAPMAEYHVQALTEALDGIDRGALARAIAGRPAGHAAAIATEMQQAILVDVPAFSQSRNPALPPDLARHCREHIEEILRLLRDATVGRFEFVQEYARRRAEQRFPLDATLHSYRSGAKILARWLRQSAAPNKSAKASQDACSRVDGFAREYTDAVSTVFASAYSSHLLLLADVAGDQRTQLLKLLLDGSDEADVRAARLLREGGFLEERQLFCVALARSVDPTEMLDAPRARRLAEAIEQIMAEVPVRRLLDVHLNKVTMVFAAVRRISGWTAPRASLAAQIQEKLAFVGNAALIGVSNDVVSASQVPNAYREAAAALEMASVGQRVVRFSEISLPRLLLHFAAQDFCRVLPAWTKEFYQANDDADGALIATLRAYADVDMNVLKAAQVLSVHPNTIYARLQRIAAISGLDARSLHPLLDLLIVSDCNPQGRRPSVPPRVRLSPTNHDGSAPVGTSRKYSRASVRRASR